MSPRLRIATPPDFRFALTVFSHGWCRLPPFGVDDAAGALIRVQKLERGPVVRLRIREASDRGALVVDVEGARRLGPAQRREIRRVVATVLNLDRDLRPFHRLLRARPRYAWAARIKAGRLLVAPTVWENLAKVLLTTNTTWGGTVQMCRRLASLGEPFADGQHCFPTAAQVASLTVKRLADRVRAGYRAPFLHALATAIAEGRIDVEAWRASGDGSSDDLYARIRELKGFGDYAASCSLMLLGRFDRLGIDTACRAVYRQQLNHGRAAHDRAIRAYYDQFGGWRALTMWMDLMSAHLRPGADPDTAS